MTHFHSHAPPSTNKWFGTNTNNYKTQLLPKKSYGRKSCDSLRGRVLKIIITYILEDSEGSPNTACETGGCGGWWHLRFLTPNKHSDIKEGLVLK